MALQLPPIRWLVPSVISEGCTILASKPKAGKSFLMLGLGLSVASGGKALGHIDCEQAGVLYLDLDGDIRDTTARFRRMTRDADVPNDFHITFEWPRMTDGAAVEEIERTLDRHPSVRLVVVDVFASLRDSDISTKNRRLYDMERQEGSMFRKLSQDRQIAVVLVHHCNKMTESEDPFDMISGSTGLVGSVHNAAVMRDHHSGNVIFYTRGRTVRRQELMLKPDYEVGSFVLEGDVDDYVHTYQQRQVLDAVAQGFTSPREIADFSGLVYGSVRHICVRMVRDGKLVRKGRGNYHLNPLTKL